MALVNQWCAGCGKNMPIEDGRCPLGHGIGWSTSGASTQRVVPTAQLSAPAGAVAIEPLPRWVKVTAVLLLLWVFGACVVDSDSSYSESSSTDSSYSGSTSYSDTSSYGSDSSSYGSDLSGRSPYTGTWSADSNGNRVPDDCTEWADSSDNPMWDSGAPDANEVAYALCATWPKY